MSITMGSLRAMPSSRSFVPTCQAVSSSKRLNRRRCSCKASCWISSLTATRDSWRFAVEGCSCPAHLVVIAVRPLHEMFERLHKRLTELCQPVIDRGRNRRIDGAQDQPVALQVAQGLGEHALRDVADQALERPEA